MKKIWWERVPNAAAFISDVAEGLFKEKIVVVSALGEIPWRGFMADNIKENVRRRDSTKMFEDVDGAEDPGIYMLNNFCDVRRRAEYRPTKSYARFLAESDGITFHRRHFWVTVETKRQMDTWQQFVLDYIKECGVKRDAASFILEWTGEGGTFAKKGIKRCALDEYVSDYDRIVFCSLAASSVKRNSFGGSLLMKTYLAELTANAAGEDIELCAQCLENCEEFLREPYAVIKNIVKTKERSNGNKFEFARSESDVEHLIWKTQIRTVYPIIEEYREDFVRKYSQSIEEHLPCVSSYGEEYNKPEDVELGMLKYLADYGLLNIDEEEYETLKVNRDARNKLSHITILSWEEVQQLDTKF